MPEPITVTINPTLTDKTDRQALLRYVDLLNEVSDLINRFNDLPAYVISNVLGAKSHEVMATAYLPQRFVPAEAAS